MKCLRCKVEYRETHYHCCICHRVFGSASAFETHQKVREKRGKPSTNARLGKLGLFLTDEGVWKRLGAYSKRGTRMPLQGGTVPLAV